VGAAGHGGPVGPRPDRLVDTAPADVPRIEAADRRFLQLHFCNGDAAGDWDAGYGRFGQELEASGLARHLWTAPFIQTVVGTDTYSDQLW
jgi:hypothetical protein